MSWNNIIGQERAKKILQRAILENKIPHAYCFWGLEGIGKDALAIEFARTVNCLAPIRTADTIDACGRCKSCVQSSSLQHPNIRLVFSLPSSGSNEDSPLMKLSDEQIQLIQEQIAQKAENPYHNISIPKATQILISVMRDLKKNLTMSAAQGGRRVIIISEAHEMRMEAANTFLKTLEEPHDDITFILTSSHREQLLDTIVSRCQQIQCDPLSDQEIAGALIENFSVDPAEARLIASFAQGSYSKATEFLDEDMKQLRNDIVDLLRTSLKSGAYRIELLRRLGSFSEQKDRSRVELMLSLLLLWLRDAYALAVTNKSSAVINGDQIETLEKFVSRFGRADYPEILQQIEHSITLVRRNVQLQLILMTVFLTCRRVFLAK